MERISRSNMGGLNGKIIFWLLSYALVLYIIYHIICCVNPYINIRDIKCRKLEFPVKGPHDTMSASEKNELAHSGSGEW